MGYFSFTLPSSFPSALALFTAPYTIKRSCYFMRLLESYPLNWSSPFGRQLRKSIWNYPKSLETRNPESGSGIWNPESGTNKWMLQVSFKLGSMEGPPGVFGEQGNTENLATGTREQSKTIVGNKGTSNRLGNRGTNTKNYKTLRFLHKRGSDRRFSAVLLMSLASFCSHLSCILVSSSGAESIFFDMCRPLVWY